MCQDDYKNHHNNRKLLSGRNLRDQVPILKKNHQFLKSVHSSPLKNAALRLKEAYEKYFREDHIEAPKYRAWKKKWFSLYFDEPKKGFKLLDDNILRISLGTKENNKKMHVLGRLKENPNLRENDKVKTFRLCKKQGKRFYAIFTIERVFEKEEKQQENLSKEKWISIDPNHKNFFVAIDYKGDSFEFEKLGQLKYWDRVIDKLKSKRDQALRKAKKRKSLGGKIYYLPSKRWERLNKALDMAYHRRREQIKSSLYAISNALAKKYDHVAIGDYTPSLDTAIRKTMHRSMLNQECIGEFRKILSWVMHRSGKTSSIIDEKGTTKTCSICGHEEKKSPEVREFVCPKCHTHLGRDMNSAINIAKKDSLLSGSDYLGWQLHQPKYTVGWDFKTSKISFVNVS